ncbi:MAG TPA: YdcF family protein [Chitinivibrionales bacterium]|nr:YdcF family protein [Chitinivibrionales bacterium]
MLLFLAKFIQMLIYPVGLAFLCAAAAGIFAVVKKRRTALVLSFASAGVLCFFSTPALTHVLTRSLEARYDPPENFPKVPAIVLLGGCTRPAVPPRDRVEITGAGNRILNAARLFKKGYAPVIIATGGKITFVYDFPSSEAQCMASVLRNDCGIDSASIILEEKAKDTHDHPPNVEKILLARGLTKEIILVTSAMHMHRSVLLFKKRGYVVHPAPTDYREDKAFQFNLFSFIPNAVSLDESTDALHEYYGIVAYWLMGWI